MVDVYTYHFKEVASIQALQLVCNVDVPRQNQQAFDCFFDTRRIQVKTHDVKSGKASLCHQKNLFLISLNTVTFPKSLLVPMFARTCMTSSCKACIRHIQTSKDKTKNKNNLLLKATGFIVHISFKFIRFAFLINIGFMFFRQKVVCI